MAASFWRFFSPCAKERLHFGRRGGRYAETLFQTLYEQRDENFGNARDVRNLFERAVSVSRIGWLHWKHPPRNSLWSLPQGDLREEESPGEERNGRKHEVGPADVFGGPNLFSGEAPFGPIG